MVLVAILSKKLDKILRRNGIRTHDPAIVFQPEFFSFSGVLSTAYKLIE